MNNTDNDTEGKNKFWQSLFKASSVAVIGANANEGSWGFNVITTLIDLQKKAKNRQIYAVNPNRSEVLGVISYKSILDIPGKVELAVIVVPAKSVPQVLGECARKQVEAAIIISAGFGEADEAGMRLEKELAEISEKEGMPFVGPNCVGHADLHSHMASIGFGTRLKSGPLAVISQSGTMGAYTSMTASRVGLGLSKFLSTGNEASQHLEDCLEYLAGDEETKIIAVYIEGLREGRRFFQLAKEITPRKPIIAIKAGGTEDSARAAMSHTGALTGSEPVYQAAFKQAGVLRVEDGEELCDLALALLHQPLPRGNRIGILTIGGGIGVVTTEAVGKEGLKIAGLQSTTLEKLNAILPPRWSHGNPVDTAGIFHRPPDQANIVLSCLGILMEDENIDCVLSLASPLISAFGFNDNPDAERMKVIQNTNKKNVKILGEYIQKKEKPLIFYDRTPPQSLEDETSISSLYLKEGIPVYYNVRRAARILRHLVKRSENIRRSAEDYA
ncbi:acetate--CoA ligase family protein [Chloroflexota bacterium]